jgi:type I restriction enzyme, S subunit
MKVVKKETISSFTEVITGGTPSTRKPEYWGGNIPWLNSGILNDGDIIKASKYITEAGLKSSSTRIMPKDTVLIALTGATTGQIGYLNIEACANQSVTGILPSKKHYPRYLYYYLKTQRKKIMGDSFGGGQPHINQQYVKDFLIPLPTIDDQIRIADILSRAESLIAKRKETIKILDEYLKSVFLDMFGDPVRNEKGWKVVSLNEVIMYINSGTSYGGTENKELEENELGVLKISAVTQGIFNPQEFKAVNKSKITKKLLFVKKGMLLFSRANTKELTGACCIVDKDYPQLFLPDKLWSIIVDLNFLHPIYLNYLLKQESCRNLVREMASGGHQSMLNVSMQKFRSLRIPVPDLKIQNKFADIVERVEKIKIKNNEGLTHLDILYNSLSQRAFMEGF